MKKNGALLTFLLILSLNLVPIAAQDRMIPDRILGIFGGMGPEATANLYQLIVAMTPASQDQEHIPTLIFSFPQVPDRTTAILSGNRGIVPYLVQGVQLLERSGATLIAIPCNTAHYYYDEMQKAVKIPIVHMIRETALEVMRLYPKTRTVGLLATSGTINTKLYHKALQDLKLKVVVPDNATQLGCVMKSIALIKAGGDKSSPRDLLAQAGAEIEKKGAEVIVLGCTEIPLAFDPSTVKVPVVNATRVLAQRAIESYALQSGRALSRQR